MSEEEIDQHDEEYESIYDPTFEEVWKTINNFKIYFQNKKDAIELPMVANLKIHCEE